MSKPISRRDFIKLSGLAAGSLASGLAFSSGFPYPEEQDQGEMVRITIKEVDLRVAPRDGAAIIGKRYRDQVVHVYQDVIPPDAPAFYNRLWYRVWGGYIHSAHTQQVGIRLNPVLGYVPETGQLTEVTVPFTQPYLYNSRTGWQPKPIRPLYFETIHWVTDIVNGPDGLPWYKIIDEISDTEVYYASAAHLRPIPNDEISPISPEVSPDHKHIEVNLRLQTLYAYENDQKVFSARISSGLPKLFSIPDEIPTETPKGSFNLYSKMPSKHMGSVTGNPDAEEKGGFSLPGVPWTMFFDPNGGVALHGTYWHTNFGLQMSHGCVNMRNADAKWLFRWSTPVFDPSKIKTHTQWEATGMGTLVEIY